MLDPLIINLGIAEKIEEFVRRDYEFAVLGKVKVNWELLGFHEQDPTAFFDQDLVIG